MVRVRIEVEEASVEGGGARRLVMSLVIDDMDHQSSRGLVAGSVTKMGADDIKRKRTDESTCVSGPVSSGSTLGKKNKKLRR